MKNNKKKSPMMKIVSAAAMLAVSASMLGTSTYAWFTMNKDVKVTGMNMKAHAEKGILINEMQGMDEGTWSEEALAGQPTAIALRPASTSDFTNWWHANSKITSGEAGSTGSGSVDANTVLISSGTYYNNISSISTSGTAASADENAARTVYYSDGVGGSSGACDEGEAYYIKYTYYIKSSSESPLAVTQGKLKATVSATKTNNDTSGTSVTLDKALRVGVKIDNNVTIFAPLADGNTVDYQVAGSTAGTTYADVTAYKGNAATAIDNTAAVTLPAVTSAGKAVDVYIWYEGEDVNCKSDNLTTVLDSYQVDITFTDADLG
ncbi:MAG: hypothetical protein K6A75_01080 [Ruminococcus sp.]|nr:hypothetical protein [Ruminococcus sp.]